MQNFFHRRMLCWFLVLLLSGVSTAGVVDDAEEVLTKVRAKQAASGEAKDGPKVYSSRSTSRSTSSLPPSASMPRARKKGAKTGGKSPSFRSRSGSMSRDDSAIKAGSKVDESREKGQVLNFAGLFLLVALVVAAVSFSNRSGENH